MKKLIAIILIVIMLATTTACTTKQKRESVKGAESRMVEVESTSLYQIVYDKYTKVMYAVSYGGYNMGTFTLLVDANGNPLLYQREGTEE